MNDAVETIRSAFPPGPHPGGGLAALMRAFGSEPGTAIDASTGWADITPEAMIENPCGDAGAFLGMMPDDFWRHYLPAWMNFVLDRGGASPYVLSSLAVTLDPEMFAQVFNDMDPETKYEGLTPEQKSAILAFAEAIRGRPDILVAAGDDVGERIARVWESRIRTPASSPGS